MTEPTHLLNPEASVDHDAAVRKGYPHPSRVVVGHPQGVVYLAAHSTQEADVIRDAIAALAPELGYDLPTYIQTWDGSRWVDVNEATLVHFQPHTDAFAAYVRSLRGSGAKRYDDRALKAAADRESALLPAAEPYDPPLPSDADISQADIEEGRA